MAQTDIVNILDDDLVTAKYITDRYDIHIRTVWVWVKNKRLPKPMIRGKKRYWYKSEIARYEQRDFEA